MPSLLGLTPRCVILLVVGIVGLKTCHGCSSLCLEDAGSQQRNVVCRGGLAKIVTLPRLELNEAACRCAATRNQRSLKESEGRLRLRSSLDSLRQFRVALRTET